MDITLTPNIQSQASQTYWQLFSLLSAMMSLTKDDDDDLLEVKTLLAMAMEKAGDLHEFISPTGQGRA